MSARAEGFDPVFDGRSLVLFLGSFPSVKSRAVRFYYGNPQNRFWRTVCGYFGAEVPESAKDKRAFALAHRFALWDIVASCEIVGSSDASIARETLADLPDLIQKSAIGTIFCNGTKAYELLASAFPELLSIARKLPSTSPANPRFSAAVWNEAMREGGL